jgi:hypothetical protein
MATGAESLPRHARIIFDQAEWTGLAKSAFANSVALVTPLPLRGKSGFNH